MPSLARNRFISIGEIGSALYLNNENHSFAIQGRQYICCIEALYFSYLKSVNFLYFWNLHNFFYINDISKKLKRYNTENRVSYIVFKIGL